MEKEVNIPLKEDIIGNIIIEKINLNKVLYPIDDSRNNIEENVTILKESKSPEEKNTAIFLAAHSGTGEIAFFNDLNKLNINDEIKLNYNSKNYTYIIEEIYDLDKTGEIIVENKNTNQLILTTCSTTNSKKQLVINSIIKES